VDSSEHNLTRGLRRQHWIHWLVIVAVTVAAGVYLLPLVRSQPESVHAFFNGQSTWLRISFIFVLCVVFTYTMFNLFSPRLGHLRHTLTHPPTWLACLLGICCAGLLDVTIGLSRYTASIWEWLGYAGGSIALVVLVRQLSVFDAASPATRKDSHPADASDPLVDWPSLAAWLRCDAPAQYDFLGSHVVARRVRELLVKGTRSVGIVGPFGIGKTSIVKWIVEMAEDDHGMPMPSLLFSQHSCWGFETSASAIHTMLADGIEEVAKRIDTFRVKSLPESYRQMFSAGGQWLDNVSKLFFRPGDPIQQFRSLSDLLREMNARLVIVVEDLDRNDSRSFDIQEVLAFLQQLKGFENLSFVLTGGIKSPGRIDFAKLCDHIEYLRTVDASQAFAFVDRVRKRCLDQNVFSHDTLSSTESSRWNPESFLLLSGFDGLWPPEALARLLNTPRALRHALGRTHHAWESLYGEVDWDHLFAVNVLRSAAPESLSFLLRHWDRLRSEPSAQRVEHEHLPQIQKTLRDDWESSTKDVEWDTKAVRSIMDFILPATDTWLGGQGQSSTDPIQGVQHERYWRRVISGSFDPGDVRDQTVLRDLREWNQSREPESSLVSGLCSSKEYCGVWEHLAPWYWRASIPQMMALTPQVISNAEQVLLLSQQVIARICKEQGSAASGDGQGFHSVWRCANQCVPHTESNQAWLKDRITEAMPVSLALVNSLFHYWGSSRFSILRQEDRDEVRRHVLQSAQKQLSTALQLKKVVHPKYPYSIYQLVFDPGEDDQPTVHRDIESWKWLGPLLLESLRQGDTTIVLEICHLVSGGRSSSLNDGRRQADPLVLHGFFGQEALEVVQLLKGICGNLEEDDRRFVSTIVESAGPAQMPPPIESRGE
jgi:hypothetical protein